MGSCLPATVVGADRLANGLCNATEGVQYGRLKFALGSGAGADALPQARFFSFVAGPQAARHHASPAQRQRWRGSLA
jgi:hypothetical protein